MLFNIYTQYVINAGKSWRYTVTIHPFCRWQCYYYYFIDSHSPCGQQRITDAHQQTSEKHNMIINTKQHVRVAVVIYSVAKKESYRTLSIYSLNIGQFSQFFSPIDPVTNLLLIGMYTTYTMSLHYLVKHKYPKPNNVYRWTEGLMVN